MRFTVSTKLNALLAGIIVTSLSLAVTLATQLFTTDLVGALKKTSMDLASLLAGRTRVHLESRLNAARNKAALLPRRPGSVHRIAVETFAPEVNAKVEKSIPVNLVQAKRGEVGVFSGVLNDESNTSFLRIVFPLTASLDEFVVAELSSAGFADLFADLTAYSNYLLDGNGRVLASSDPVSVPVGMDMNRFDLAKTVRESTSPSGQLQFVDHQNVSQIASYHSVGLGRLTVVSQVSTAKAETATFALQRRILTLGTALICFALSFGLFFSRNMTNPIRKLARAAEQIRQGDFNVTLETRPSGDEIVQFSDVFNRMAQGLRDREQLKTTFSKFHSKDVAEQILAGRFALGGQRKSAVVLFSDIRGFTALSESMKPEDVVALLNRYFEKMVTIIHSSGGIVDKFIGDAILAVWGLQGLQGHEPVEAVHACLNMRAALQDFNEELERDGLPRLQIGMGLHSGMLVAGTIGSEERMEYTVMGDTVNTAARIENITKETDTDLLISHAIFEQVRNDFELQPIPPVSLRGKRGYYNLYQVPTPKKASGAAA